MHHSIPVICDRCRAEGLAGEDPFAAFGALLDFEPVPRRTSRADGWDAEVQRAFIAALSLTGSPRQAARAVGKAAYGAEQLRRAQGNEGFLAAWDQAMALSADERSRRLAEGLRAVAAEQSGWRPSDPPWARAASRGRILSERASGRRTARRAAEGPAAEAGKPGAAREWLNRFVRNYLMKVEQERKARLSGKIVAADFYLRQMTWQEVALDLMSGDGFKVLEDFRCAGHDLVDIAETPMSKLMGEARRMKWAELGEPPRPEHPPRHLLVDHGGFSTEPLEYTKGGIALSHEEQRRIFDERHARDAEEQIAWEARARADAAARRERSEAAPQDPPRARLGEGDHPKDGGGGEERSLSGGQASTATGEAAGTPGEHDP
jgi:hypothetical protein